MKISSHRCCGGCHTSSRGLFSGKCESFSYTSINRIIFFDQNKTAQKTHYNNSRFRVEVEYFQELRKILGHSEQFWLTQLLVGKYIEDWSNVVKNLPNLQKKNLLHSILCFMFTLGLTYVTTVQQRLPKYAVYHFCYSILT